MNLFQLFKNIRPFVRPYRWLVVITLILTLVGSLMAQVNAIVLDRTVDAINALIGTDFTWAQAARIMTVILFFLLVQSKNTCKSVYVKNEIKLTISNAKTIRLFCIDNNMYDVFSDVNSFCNELKMIYF